MNDTRAPLPPRGVIAIYGPDGAGKSALAAALADQLPGDVLQLHHRPRVLPGRTAAGEAVTDPHAKPPYPVAVSLGKLLYLFVDHLLGWWLHIRPARRQGWVVLERGWWDLTVDWRRYRMHRSTLAELLARLLPRPGVTVVLDAPAEVMLARKREIETPELHRQLSRWRQLAAKHQWTVIDAAATPEVVVRAVRAAITATAVLPPHGHAGLPLPHRARMFIPRSPRRAAHAGLLIEQPSDRSKVVAWRLLRVAARLGVFRFWPRSRDHLVAEHQRMRKHLPYGGLLAIMRSRRKATGYVALLMDRSGRPVAFAKCANTEAARASLRAEAAAQMLTSRLRAPLRAPRVRAVDEGILFWEPVLWRPKPRPWQPPSDVLYRLGALFQAANDPQQGGAHGDFAPWNLLRTDTGWVLVDWADAANDFPAFYDVFHYLVQSHATLGRPRRRALLAGVLTGQGWVGQAIRVYARGGGLDPADAAAYLLPYFTRSDLAMDPTDPRHQVVSRARRALRDAAAVALHRHEQRSGPQR